MVAFKAGDSFRIARSPKASIIGYLIYGNDAAQIAETARALSQALAAQIRPPGSIIRIDEQDAANAPGRIGVELQTMPLFGGRPVVWVRSASAAVQAEIEEVLTAGTLASALVVEAGNLAKGAKLRQLFEQRADLAALPCYGDDFGSIAAMIEREMETAGSRLEPDAVPILKDRLGPDLAGARREIEKLLLYAHGESSITADMVAEAIGDCTQSAVDELIAAVFAGDARSVPLHLGNLEADGVTMQSVLALVQLHLLRLVRARAAMESGATAETAMRQLRPPIHFKIEKRFLSEMRRHNLKTLLQFEAGLIETMRRSRMWPSLDRQLVERFLMETAAVGRPPTASGGTTIRRR